MSTTRPSPAGEPVARSDRDTLIAFVFFVILGGAATVAMRYTFVELPTFWGAAMRFFLAALIFWGLVRWRRAPLPRGRGLLGAVLFGALSVGGAFTLLYWGLVETPAGLFQTLIALVPLLTLFLAVVQGQERLRLRGVAGALLSVAGIVVALGGSLGGAASPPHLLAVLAGALCMAEASVVARHYPETHPLSTNAVAMTVGALVLLVASLLSGEPRVYPASPGVWLAFLFLVLGASVGWFLLYVMILKRWTASATSYGFVLSPIITVSLAALFLGETVAPIFVAGSALVLAGVWVGALRESP